MKTIVFAAAALALTAGSAFAENPYVGRDDVVQSGLHAGTPLLDRQPTASTSREGRFVVKRSEAAKGYSGPAVGRFADSAPRP